MREPDDQHSYSCIVCGRSNETCNLKGFSFHTSTGDTSTVQVCDTCFSNLKRPLHESRDDPQCEICGDLVPETSAGLKLVTNAGEHGPCLLLCEAHEKKIQTGTVDWQNYVESAAIPTLG